MRDFSWKYFTMTGDVDAYLLFKEMDGEQDEGESVDEPSLLDDTLE
jgi:hypothetical protein